MMCNLVERTLDDVVLIYLFETFEAKSVATRKRQGLLLGMIVLFEAHPTFKYRVHYFNNFRFYVNNLIYNPRLNI